MIFMGIVLWVGFTIIGVRAVSSRDAEMFLLFGSGCAAITIFYVLRWALISLGLAYENLIITLLIPLIVILCVGIIAYFVPLNIRKRILNK